MGTDTEHQKAMAESNMSKEHIMAIGLLAAEWCYVESMFELLIWDIAKLPKSVGYSLTTHAGSVMRMDMLRTLANEVVSDQEVKDGIDVICTEFDRLRTRRNDIIHSLWFRPLIGLFQMPDLDGDPLSYRIKARGKIDIRANPISSQEIRQAVSDMTGLVVAISGLLNNLKSQESAPQ